jgi:tetratricopeptide (TPR) repeat protein
MHGHPSREWAFLVGPWAAAVLLAWPACQRHAAEPAIEATPAKKPAASIEEGPGIKDLSLRSLLRVHKSTWRGASLETLLEEAKKTLSLQLQLQKNLPDTGTPSVEADVRWADLLLETYLKYLPVVDAHDDPDGKGEAERASAVAYREKAIKAYALLLQSHPAFDGRDEAMFCLAWLLLEVARTEPDEDKSNAQKARTVCLAIITSYPESPMIYPCYLAFGEFYYDEGDVSKALQLYEKVEQGGDAGLAALAVYKKAWCLLRLQSYPESAKAFQGVIDFAKAHPDDPDSAALLERASAELTLAEQE